MLFLNPGAAGEPVSWAKFAKEALRRGETVQIGRAGTR